MADYPTNSTGNLKKFFTTIQETGVPPTVTNHYLSSLGYKSSNDRTMIGVLKFIGFVDQANKPTDKWRDYRDKQKARGVTP